MSLPGPEGDWSVGWALRRSHGALPFSHAPVGPGPWPASPGSLLKSKWSYILSRIFAWGCSSTPCCRPTLQGSGPYLTRPASKLSLDPRCRHNSSPQTACENGKAQCDLRSAHPIDHALFHHARVATLRGRGSYCTSVVAVSARSGAIWRMSAENSSTAAYFPLLHCQIVLMDALKQSRGVALWATKASFNYPCQVCKWITTSWQFFFLESKEKKSYWLQVFLVVKSVNRPDWNLVFKPTYLTDEGGKHTHKKWSIHLWTGWRRWHQWRLLGVDTS